MLQEVKINTFRNIFTSDDECLKLLADLKWEKGFVCKSCGHTNYCKGKNPYSRRCTRCKKDESATAHTAFHRCKFPLAKAFEIAWTVCTDPTISSYEICRQVEIRHMTCYTFQKKMINCQEPGSRDELLSKVIKEVNLRVRGNH